MCMSCSMGSAARRTENHNPTARAVAGSPPAIKAGVAAVTAFEEQAGRSVTEMPHNHPGYDLESRGLVTKTASSSDARGNVAKLTPRDMAKLKTAWRVHLASVRRRVFDSIDAAAVEGVAKALADVAAHLEDA